MQPLASFSFGLCLACSAAPSSGQADAAPDARYGHRPIDAGEPAVDGSNACPGDQPSTTYPAAHPKLPQVISSGGPVLAHPRFVPIVFSGEDRTADIGAFITTVGKSSYWTSIAGEYGVSPATATSPVIAPETPPAQIDDTAIQAWLQGKLDGSHPDFGAPDPSSIYVLYYPAATSITAGFEGSCTSFLGYHAETKVGKAGIVYAVIARCPTLPNSMTGITSHELFEAVTDPYYATAPAYAQIDDTTNGVFWTGHEEIGDLCEGLPEHTPTDVGYPVVPIWSNAASAGGKQPCVPNDGAPNFRAMPETEDVPLAPGETTTIKLVAFSDQPTAPWTLTVQQYAPDWTNQVSISLCRTTVQNGESVPVTITRLYQATQPSYVTINSWLNGVKTTASFTVGD